MYATKYVILQKNGHIVDMSVMCPLCGCWIGIDKMQADQGHQCPKCQRVFIETPNRKDRDVTVGEIDDKCAPCINYEEELDKMQRVAHAINCLNEFIEGLECRYEASIVALFRIQHGLVVKDDPDGKAYTKGGLVDAIANLSEVIAKLQLELGVK